MIGDILERNIAGTNGIGIRGSLLNSDFYAFLWYSGTLLTIKAYTLIKSLDLYSIVE